VTLSHLVERVPSNPDFENVAHCVMTSGEGRWLFESKVTQDILATQGLLLFFRKQFFVMNIVKAVVALVRRYKTL
jgi:hypothetical protein